MFSRHCKLVCIARDLHGSCNERALGIGHNLALELASICTLGIWKLRILTGMLLIKVAGYRWCARARSDFN